MKYSKTIAGITIEICEKAIGEDLVLTLSETAYWLCCSGSSTPFVEW